MQEQEQEFQVGDEVVFGGACCGCFEVYFGGPVVEVDGEFLVIRDEDSGELYRDRASEAILESELDNMEF
tara:strand:- start:449 stop:658 length:210 start_codon:yes stop_codon:yes gene_type:complete